MAISYDAFKKKYPSGSVVCSLEGYYCGECVSYLRQYMKQVHGVVTGPLGNAVDFATNPTFLKYYTKVSSPKVGDILIWGDDPGSWTDAVGHIAIFDGPGYMMNSNYGGSLKVSRNKIFTQGFIGYYRLKEEKEVIGNKNHVNILFRQFFGRSAKTSEKDRFSKQTLEYLLNNGLYKHRTDLPTVLKENAALKKKVTELEAKLSSPSEAQTTLDKIKALFNK